MMMCVLLLTLSTHTFRDIKQSGWGCADVAWRHANVACCIQTYYSNHYIHLPCLFRHRVQLFFFGSTV